MGAGGNAADAGAAWRALVDGAGLVALDWRTLLVATGDDRVEFLNGMLTNDVARLEPGAACPALLLTIQGRVTADVDVLRLDDALWLLVDEQVADDAIAALEKLIVADDVEVARAPEWVALGLVGAGAVPLLADVGVPAPWRHATTTIEGVAVRLLRGAPLGDDDVTILVPRTDAGRVGDTLVRLGAVRCDAAAFDARRVALGVPRVGVDMGRDTLAIEMPVAHRISDRKGCYLGQEVVARGTSRGKVNRGLRGLVFDGPPPAPGTPLVAGEAEVGVVTSVAAPPAAPAPIGLGLVRREHWEPGTTLATGAPGGRPAARVTDWPLA